MSYNPYNLEGKTILVTGASSGIGQATAIECSKMGAHVIITGRNKERLAQTFDLLEGSGHQCISVDLSDISGVTQLVNEVPLIDGFLNNAGITAAKPISFISESELDRILDINLRTPILLTNLLVKKKRIAKGGSIVFTSSIGRYMVAPGNSMYAASKGGLSAFMKGAALELAAKGIRCNAILPGMVETAIMINKGEISEEQWEKNKQLYPLKRYGGPKEVAWLAVYLFSDASSFMTGSELVIDGGRSLK
jgi:NAD(P)-dependent dehydrogenase (short-subunit alcohol dehydrogenase family)